MVDFVKRLYKCLEVDGPAIIFSLVIVNMFSNFDKFTIMAFVGVWLATDLVESYFKVTERIKEYFQKRKERKAEKQKDKDEDL